MTDMMKLLSYHGNVEIDYHKVLEYHGVVEINVTVESASIHGYHVWLWTFSDDDPEGFGDVVVSSSGDTEEEALASLYHVARDRLWSQIEFIEEWRK